MSSGLFEHIQWGDNLTVTPVEPVEDGVIRVDAGAGGGGGGALPDPPWTVDPDTGEIVGTFPFPTDDTTALTIVRDGGGSDPNVPLAKIWVTDDDYSSYALDIRGVGHANSDGKGIRIVASTGTKGGSDGSLAIGIGMGGIDSSGGVLIPGVVAYGHGEAIGISIDVRSEGGQANGIWVKSSDHSPDGDNTPWDAGYMRALKSVIDATSDNTSRIEHISLVSELHYANDVTGLLINLNGGVSGVGVPDWDGGFASGVSINMGHVGGNGEVDMEGISVGINTQHNDKAVGGRFHISPHDPNDAAIAAAITTFGGPIVMANQPEGDLTYDPADYVTAALISGATGGGALLYVWDDSGTMKLVANVNGTKTILATG